MKRGRVLDRTTHEAVGCFTLLILGAILSLGIMIVVPGDILVPPGQGQPDWRRSVLLWVVTPAIGMAVVGWLTFRHTRSRREMRPK